MIVVMASNDCNGCAMSGVDAVATHVHDILMVMMCYYGGGGVHE